MTMPKPQLVQPQEDEAFEPPPPPPRKQFREGTVGVVSAVLGAVLALGVGVIQDNRRLSPHPPTVGVTAVRVFTPEIATPDPNKPMPPAVIDKQIATLHDHLGVSDEEMSVPSDKAADLIAANVAAAASLDVIDSPLRYIRVNTWLSSIEKAAKGTIGYYSEKALIEQMRAVFEDKSLSPDQAKAAFLKILEQHPDHDGAFDELVAAYQISADDEAVKQIEKNLQQISFRPVVWQPLQWEEGEFKLHAHGFSIGKIGIVLRHRNNIGRAMANAKIALLISRFDRDSLGQVARLATSMLLSEIDKLGSFLATSDKLIRSEVEPRLSVESSAFNDSRSALTIAPRAVLRIAASTGAHFDVQLNLVSSDATTKSTTGSESVASPKSALQYATIESGKLGRLVWTGEFHGTASEWSSLAKAFESGTLNCELSVQTVDGLVARSPAAPFGESAGASDSAVLKIADAKL